MNTFNLKPAPIPKEGPSSSRQDSAMSSAFLPESEVSGGREKPVVTNSLFSMRLFNAAQDLPFVYTDHYNMSLFGVELLHNFDSKKYGKMAEALNEEFQSTPYARLDDKADPNEEKEAKAQLQFLAPNRPVNFKELGFHHKVDYITRIHNEKSMVARIIETWVINLLPMSSIRTRLLKPIKWQIAGTIFATHLAMQHGWAINLGGGFHQSSSESGETFCLFSDVLLAIKYVWRKHPFQKFLIIDLDAHQATGVEIDLNELSESKRKAVFILDVFNETIHPPNEQADKAIDIKVSLGRFTGDDTYLKRLKQALSEIPAKFNPTMVIYIAGQDALKDDQLGLMNLSDQALIQRDELVFSWAVEQQKCPIVMLLGGGYLKRGVKVQASSIKNLYDKSLIWSGHKSGAARSLSRPRPELLTLTSKKDTKSQSHSIKPGKVIITPVTKNATKVAVGKKLLGYQNQNSPRTGHQQRSTRRKTSK